MSFRNALLVCLLMLLCAAGNIYAQAVLILPPSVQKPWNQYSAARIPNSFNSIVNNGGTLITGTSGVGAYNYVASFTLPMNFYFIGTTYPQGYTCKVGTNGYIGFNGSTYTGGPSYEYYGVYWYNYFNSNALPCYTKVLYAYATDLQTSGVADGGVYYKVSGSSPNRVLVVEWRVGSGSRYPGQVGNFQVVLYENTGKIQWFFGPAAITVPYVQNDSYNYAVCGIKNLGENYYYGGTNPATVGRTPATESDRYYVFSNPSLKPNSDTIVFSSLDVAFYAGSVYYLDVYNLLPGYSQNWNQYTFPTEGGNRIGFQLSPVFDDMATDSLWLTPTRTANAYPQGAAVTVNARFRNIGVNTRTNVPVQCDVYSTGTGASLLYSSTTTSVPISPGAQFNSISANFSPAMGGAVTNNTGIYEIRVYTKLTSPLDQDFSNDTMKVLFYVTKPNDVMAYQILQPYSNVPPLFYQYPTGVAVPLEVRFLNIGTNTQFNVPVGFTITNASGVVQTQGTSVVAGAWTPIAFRDIVFTGGWTPTVPGRYYLKAFTMLPGDENPYNDTLTAWPSLGFPFDVAYEIETAIDPNAPRSPNPGQCYPIGKPVPVFALFQNYGISDATNVPANVTITNASGQIVYNRNVTILSIVAGTGPSTPGQTTQAFPDFIPPTQGTYTVTATVNYPNDPVTTNNVATWQMCVKSPILGTIRVGTGERFRTIQEAWDSVAYYGVGGNVNFELIDDSYTVPSPSFDGSLPAMDMRRKVVGIGPNATVTFRPESHKTMVTVTMQSASGIGMWMGQLDTVNPSGYVNWDGGANKSLTFYYQNMSTNPADPYGGYTRSIPFYFGRGASNYSIKNCRIYPQNTFSAQTSALAIPVATYNQSFNQFTYPSDYTLNISSGILMRNSLRPSGLITGTLKGGATGQAVNPDTLRNQNNVFDGNIIDGFGYGITSIGLGPLYNVGQGRYVEYNNQNNQIINNTITNVSRAGVMVVWEKGSQIIGNTIRQVDNTALVGPLPNVAGIWASAGGNATGNRGYSTDLRIEKNKVSRMFAGTGNATGICIETAENVFVSPSNVTYRFPSAGTNMQIWNNMVWRYSSTVQPSVSAGICYTVEPSTRIDYVATGNKTQDNTVYNQISGNTSEFGVLVSRAAGPVTNNIIALSSTSLSNPTGLLLNTMNQTTTVPTDYNLYWVPNGYLGQVLNLSSQGYSLPSMPAAKTLEQWRYASRQDGNSVNGNITAEFMNVNPGSEDLHLNPTITGGLASNRGIAVSGLLVDIDGDQRSPAGSANGMPDIGADEYNGALYNYDLASNAVIGPVGYQAITGQYSDAEYVMTDSNSTLTARVRNLGGQPLLNNTATLTVERWTGSAWVSTGVTYTRPVSVNIASSQDINFGTFQPQTLREFGQNDPFYGLNPNVTPVYRLTLTTGGQDQNTANNVYQKTVRYYVQRSTRKTLVAVKYWAPATAASTIANAVDKGNKLNADTLFTALNRGGWDRADGVGREDFDLFERDKWPTYSDNFKPWKTVVWAQGEEATGLDPWERSNLKEMLDSRDLYNRSNLLISGQEVARIHDVALTASNGAVADQEFVQTYLRTQYRGVTNPALYDGLRIQGVKVNPGVYEKIMATGVAGDAGPAVGIVRATNGNGVAYPAHKYVDQASVSTDTASGIATFASIKNSIYYAIDWRHFGRLPVDSRSGAMRIAMGSLDLFEQNKGILPIHLVNFEAYQSSPKAVTVSWQTSSEVDVASMEIERAEVIKTTGTDVETGVYRMIEKRNSTGSAVSGSKYSVVDEGVAQGRTYVYRLVSVGLDGSRVNEGEKTVQVTGQGESGGMELTASPNPVLSGGELEVNYRVSAGEKVRIVVYDELGKQVSVVKEGVEASGVGSGSLKGLVSGTYTVVLEGENGSRVVEKVVVQK